MPVKTFLKHIAITYIYLDIPLTCAPKGPTLLAPPVPDLCHDPTYCFLHEIVGRGTAAQSWSVQFMFWGVTRGRREFGGFGAWGGGDLAVTGLTEVSKVAGRWGMEGNRDVLCGGRRASNVSKTVRAVGGLETVGDLETVGETGLRSQNRYSSGRGSSGSVSSSLPSSQSLTTVLS